MPLGFLVPAFLLGLAAVGVAVWVHLTRRQRSRVVRFPSLMFLSRIPSRSTRRRKIRHWALLALRSLALVLLAAAFARPFFRDTELAAGATLGPREVVVVLDRSFSMGVGERWERARAAVREAFQGLGPYDRASLVAFSPGATALNRSTSDRARLLASLDSLAPGSGVTRYGPALKLAETILEESELPNRELVLVSDFQRVGWTGDEGVSLPPGAVVTPVDVAGEPPPNTAVTDLELGRQLFSGRERVVVTARLVHRGGEGVAGLPVTLEVDGRELETVTVDLPPDGSGTVTFQPFTLAGAFTRGTVRARGDALPADDVRHFVASPGEAVSVLVLDGGGSEDPSLFLARALGISEGSRYRIEVRRTARPDAEALDGRAVVILNDVAVPGGASGEALRSFVEAGGALLVALGDRSGGGEAPALLPGAVGAPRDHRGGVRLAWLDYGHPVFELFSRPGAGDFSRARFFRTRPLELDDSARVLARFDDGEVALAEHRVGEGTVLTWTSTLDTYWNDLPLQPVFLPFVHQITEYLGAHAAPVPWHEAGQVVDLARSEPLMERVRRQTGDGPTERVALAPGGGSRTLTLGDGPAFLELGEHGFYEVREAGSDEERPFVLAVNVDPAESDLEPLDEAELVAAIGPRVAASRDGEAVEPELRVTDLERRQALWRFLLLGAFGLLAVETVLSNRLSRGRSGEPAVG